ncbi:MAG: hypothetical protein ACYTGB_09785 [Planctomycetota bacterium]|jgi:hypothetical protein
MRRIAIALSVILFGLALPFGRGTARAAGAGWAILNPDGNYDAQLENQKAVLDLLRNGASVYWFVKGGGAPAKLKRGDYVVLASQADTKYAAAVMSGIPADRQLKLGSVAGWKGYKLSFPRVMLDGNKYAKTEFYEWYFRCLRPSGLRIGHWGGSDAKQLEVCDVLVVAGGSGGPDAKASQVMRDFQKRGGAFVGSCNAGLIFKQPPSEKPKDKRIRLGTGLLEAQCPVVLDGGSNAVTKKVAADHPVMWHMPAEFVVRHANGPVLESTGSTCTVLATLKEAQWKSNKKAQAEGKGIWLAGQRPGQGRVVVFGSHPEFRQGKRFVDGHRGVYDAIFWCTAGDEGAVQPANGKSDQPAGWLDLGGKAPDAAKGIAAAKEAVSAAVKINQDAPKYYWRGTHKNLAGKDLASLLKSLDVMQMAGGGDKAGWFAKRREELIAELVAGLKKWPTPFKWGSGEMTRNMPTEIAVKFEEWVRDYERFLKANGR